MKQEPLIIDGKPCASVMFLHYKNQVIMLHDEKNQSIHISMTPVYKSSLIQTTTNKKYNDVISNNIKDPIDAAFAYSGILNITKQYKHKLDNIKIKKVLCPFIDHMLNGNEYDLSSDEGSYDSDSSDSEAFVISKKPKAQKLPKPQKPPKPATKFVDIDSNLRGEVNELKNMITELAKMQQKQNKTIRKQTSERHRRSSSRSGKTNIVVLPQNTSGGGQTNPVRIVNDDYMEKLRKSIFE